MATEPRTFPGIALRGAWPLGSNAWKPEMDDNLRKLSALVQLVVKSRVAAVPGVAVNGDIYLVTAGANADTVAIRDDDAWIYIPVGIGWQAYDTSTAESLIFVSGDWAVMSSGGGGISDAPSDGEVYGRQNGDWTAIGAGGIDTLAELSDVDLTTAPANGQTLVFDGPSGKWKALTPGLTAYTINNQGGAAYTLVAADRSKIVRMTSNAANTITVPTGLAVGGAWTIRQAGDGKTGIAADTGVTINTAETLYLRKRGSTATLICVAVGEYDLTGDLELTP